MDMPLVCVSLRGCTISEVLKDAASATATGADLVEVRLDMLWSKQEIVTTGGQDQKSPSREDQKINKNTVFTPQEFEYLDLDSVLISLRQGIVLPVILTCRPEREGGYFPGTEKQRLEVMKKAIESGVSWVDLEINIDDKERTKLCELAKKGGTKIIASSHVLDESPISKEIIQDVKDSTDLGDIIKVCYKSAGRSDGINLFEAAWDLRNSDIKNSIMGLGQAGDWNRIHSPILGQAIVYSTMENGWHLAQKGMMNTTDLRIAWEMLEYR
tara:strand:+ start:540 stop:1349 length:810 start_codon:yes stop_codon:yes gene_type:complete